MSSVNVNGCIRNYFLLSSILKRRDTKPKNFKGKITKSRVLNIKYQSS